MSYPTTQQTIGGQGGSPFSFTGYNSCASLEKIWVWVGGWQIKAVRAWLSDGTNKTFGEPSGPHKEFVFKPDDLFTGLSLWRNGAGTRLGAIKFKTKDSQGNEREFFSKMTEWGLKREYPIEVGSGYCLGIFGRAGADIDAMGFIFLNAVESIVLTNVKYPTLHQLIPKVAIDELKSISYENKTSAKQEQKIETSKNVTKTSSWSMTKSSSLTLNMEVKTGIPEVVEVSTGFSVTVGDESTYSLAQMDKRKKALTTTIEVPPQKKVDVDITIGRASFDLPYTGTVKINCKNGGVLQYETKGQYKGVTYTDIKVKTQETDLYCQDGLILTGF